MPRFSKAYSTAFQKRETCKGWFELKYTVQTTLKIE